MVKEIGYMVEAGIKIRYGKLECIYCNVKLYLF